IGTYRQFLRAESNLALGARMMVETNEWLLPHAPHELPLNKPPLQYWLTGIPYKMFGFNHGAARMPAALCGLGVMALIYFLGLRLHSESVGLTAAAILATSYSFWSFTRLAMPDMLLTFCVSAALVCWILVITDLTTRPRTLALLGYGAAALGFLAKGPVAIALSLLPVLLDALIVRDFTTLRRLRPVSGLLVLLVIGSPYFLLVYASDGLEPLRNFFINENLHRFTGTIYTTQTHALFEVMSFFGDFAPWSPLLIIAACALLPWKSFDQITQRLLRFLLIWMILPIVLFSFSRFTLDYYLLPGMPPAALIVAHGIFREGPLSPSVRRAWFVIALTILILLPIATILTIRIVDVNFPDTQLRWLPHMTATITLLAVVVCIIRRWMHRALGAIFVGLWVTTLSAYMVFLPSYSRFQPAEMLAASVPSASHVYASSRAVTWALDLALYLPASQPVKHVTKDWGTRQLGHILQTDPQAVALIYEQDYGELRKRGVELHVLAQADAYKDNRLTLKSLLFPTHEKLYVVTRQHRPMVTGADL
ncbi:MAG: ArnT family glycosyltransferase, partial [Nitrospiraceae bacterium]